MRRGVLFIGFILALLFSAPSAKAQGAGTFFCPSTNTWIAIGQSCGGSGQFSASPTVNLGTSPTITTATGADWCAAIAAADTALGANPGEIIVPSTLAGTCSAALTLAYNGLGATRVIKFGIGKFSDGGHGISPLPNDGGSPLQKSASIRITGILPSFATATGTISGGTQIDLTNNAAVSKIETLGQGTLEIDHIAIIDDGSDSAVLFFDTNTTLAIHNTIWSGTASGASAVNDALILGGTGTTSGNLTTSIFQGYGSVIRDNIFAQVKRAALFQSGANNIVFTANYVQNSGNPTGAPVEFAPSASGSQSSSNYITGNLFELPAYKFCISVTQGQTVTGNMFVGNGCWDTASAPADTTALYNFAAGQYNTVIPGISNVTTSSGITLSAGANVSLNNFVSSLMANSTTAVNPVALVIPALTGTSNDFSGSIQFNRMTSAGGSTPSPQTISLSNSVDTINGVWTFTGGALGSSGLRAVGTSSISGCSLSSALGGVYAGSFIAGATSCTVTVTLDQTANGYSCWATDLTTPADSFHQSAFTTTTATLTGTVALSDHIIWGCVEF